MKPRPELVDHVLELLAPLGTLRVKAMFGGFGFYCDEHFFALIAEQTLYLKADPLSEPAFRAAGCRPFTYANKAGAKVTMSYWSAPDEALESPAAMQEWGRLALAAALRAAAKKASSS